MKPENIDGPLNSMSVDIEESARWAYRRFLELLGQGVSPREAMEMVRLTFEGDYFAALSKAFERVLDERWPEVRLRAYSVGEVTLSQALYANWKQTEGTVSGLVERHAKGVQQARDLALELFTGYGLRQGEVLNFGQRQIMLLPQELRELVRSPDVRDAFKVVMGRARAATLRTSALQSAYLQAFDEALAGAAQDRLDKLLKVAMQEKLRYFGNRIAQTELALAHAVARGDELLEDDTITVVQWRLSGNHPRADICDLMAKVDRYGLGPGCFPKRLAPRPIAHPFCRCRLRSRPDLDAGDARERSGAELDYLDNLEDWQAARLVGSRAKLERVKNGEAARDVWNDGKIDRHQVPLLGGGGGPGGGGGSNAAGGAPPLPPLPSQMLDGLASRLALSRSAGVEQLWASKESYYTHLAQRINRGQVLDAAEYYQRILTTIVSADKITVSYPRTLGIRPTGKLISKDRDWVVLLTAEGGVVTSYPVIIGRPTFEMNETARGELVHEYQIPPDTRRRIAGILGID